MARSLRRRLASLLIPEPDREVEFRVLYEFLEPTLLKAARSFDGESKIICQTFSLHARSHLQDKGILVYVPQRGRWPEEWAVSSKARELLKDLPGGRCLEAV